MGNGSLQQLDAIWINWMHLCVNNCNWVRLVWSILQLFWIDIHITQLRSTKTTKVYYRVTFSLVSPRKVLGMELVPPDSEKMNVCTEMF